MAGFEKRKFEGGSRGQDRRGGRQKRRGQDRRGGNNQREVAAFDINAWKPKTELGKLVKEGRISDIKDVLESGKPILEAEIVDALLPGTQNDLLMVGQAKGKLGGGQRRTFKQTQKKTKEGNKPSFSTYAIVGNSNGYIGLGYGKAKETVPAREKAVRNAKLNLIQIARGSGDWESDTRTPHTIPFAVNGQCGSVRLRLMPAPLGSGLVIEPECAKVLKMAGIRDVWSHTEGSTNTKVNMLKACFDALKNLSRVKVRGGDIERLGIVYGAIKKEGAEQAAPVAQATPAGEQQ